MMPAPEMPDPKRNQDAGVHGKGAKGTGAPPTVLVAFIALPELPLGRILATPGALGLVPPEEIRAALQRHRRRDWGTLDPEDLAANERALAEGTRILSSYRSMAGLTFWIITEADRSLTTVLLPEEY